MMGCAPAPPSGAEAARSRTERTLAIVRQTVLIVAGFGAYLGVRILAIGSRDAAFSNARELLHIEDALGIDVEQQLQRGAHQLPRLVDVCNFVYAWTYWPFIVAVFVLTWFWRRDLFVIYRNAMVVSGAVGLVIFTFVPVAPPRFLSGFNDTVGAAQRGNFIARPAGLVNEFAALPSFHVGWVALASLAVALGTTRLWLRCLLIVPTLVMAVTVVVTGNHYVLDIVVGIGLAVMGIVLAVRRSNRRAGCGDPEPTPDRRAAPASTGSVHA